MPTPKPSRSTTGARPPAEQLPQDVQRALALRDVMQHAVEVEQDAARKSGPRKPRTTLVLTAICVPLLAFSAWSYVARPEAIWGPRAEFRSPAEAEANTRFALFFLAQRLAEYHRREGAYPAALSDIGMAPSAIDYRLVTDSEFELSAGTGASRLILRSTDDWDAFLAPSAQLLKGRGE